MWALIALFTLWCVAFANKAKNLHHIFQDLQLQMSWLSGKKSTKKLNNNSSQWVKYKSSCCVQHSPLVLQPLSLLLLLLYSGQTSSLCQQSGRLLSVRRPTNTPACGRAGRLCVCGGRRDGWARRWSNSPQSCVAVVTVLITFQSRVKRLDRFNVETTDVPAGSVADVNVLSLINSARCSFTHGKQGYAKSCIMNLCSFTVLWPAECFSNIF